jgi:hypothetical protein
MRIAVNADGSLRATIVGLSYTYGGDASRTYLPYPGVPAGAGSEHVGDIFKLVHRQNHLLYQSWNNADGSNYLCDSYATGAGWQQCGA